MQKQSTDLFAADQRLQKMAQYTKVLDALNKLVDWVALANVVNDDTGREAPQPKGGRPAYPTKTPNTPYLIAAAGNALLA